ncbi:MAG: delta-aminolevulinic acid dehydratase [Blastocatellia bacterium]|nr:delta-aminolevulinic acid dehydratase [Blastocatellia bacterium]
MNPSSGLSQCSVPHHFDLLLAYCQNEGWQGYDPYDGLNAFGGRATSLLPGKWARIALIQGCKRSPLNFRPLLLIPKRANPKGHGLAVRALLARAGFARQTGESEVPFESEARRLLQELDGMRSADAAGAAWGYPFDWQSRAFFVPQGSPSIVCSTFVAQAYLDAFERFGTNEYLATARSTCDFILKDLGRTPDPLAPQDFCFSYTQLDETQVHNASLLGAALLARVFHFTREPELQLAAQAATRFSLRRQRADGSWPYGEAPNQQWIDSFHTGFNLICLDEVLRFGELPEAAAGLKRGFQFFCDRFFLPDGTPRYYHENTYPIDVHAAAQAFVTLARLAHLDERAPALLERCWNWTLTHLAAPAGYFYFQQTKWFTNRVSYLRWSQTWMLYGMAALLSADHSTAPGLRTSFGTED